MPPPRAAVLPVTVQFVMSSVAPLSTKIPPPLLPELLPLDRAVGDRQLAYQDGDATAHRCEPTELPRNVQPLIVPPLTPV